MTPVEDDELVPPEALIDEVHVGRGNFRGIGDYLASRPFREGWISPNDAFLDIGCGLGRVARPLTRLISPEGRYIGFDINKTSIDWCQEKYRGYPNFRFEWIDLKSVFYNPGGKTEAKSYRFPLADESVDYANLSSVFTHMLPDDVRNYLSEVSRMLRPGKRCLITYFLIDPRSTRSFSKDVAEGKYYAVGNHCVRNPQAPEEMMLLDEDFVRRSYDEAGLEIESLTYGAWYPRDFETIDYQDFIVAKKP